MEKGRKSGFDNARVLSARAFWMVAKESLYFMWVGVRSRHSLEPPPERKKGLTMKNLFKRRGRIRRRKALYNGADPHKWANKMEIHRLTTGKADLQIKR